MAGAPRSGRAGALGRSLLACLAVLALIPAAAGAVGSGAADLEDEPPAARIGAPDRAVAEREARPCLSPGTVAKARRWAKRRRGDVSFAFADECSRVVGLGIGRVHASASVVKAMLLVAYLRRDGVRRDELRHDERRTLGPMIRESDNRSAREIFAVVGQSGLADLARAAGMKHFEPSPSWGGSGIAAGDQAAFFRRIERWVPRRHEDYVLRLLAGVIRDQRWGVPEVTPRGWKVHFKGGWYPAGEGGWRVNQSATLRRGERSIGVSVLSEGTRSYRYGRETIRGVAKILLGRYRR